MQNQYETTIIITPVLSEGDIKNTIDTYREFLKTNGAEMIHEDHWGLRQLAYPIKKKTTGVYHLYEFKADTDLIDKLELNFRRDENIMRYLTVRLDKYAVEYNEKKRKGLIGRKRSEESENKQTQEA